jgi:hypothetical protein
MTELVIVPVVYSQATIKSTNVSVLTLCETDYVTRVLRKAQKDSASVREVLR